MIFRSIHNASLIAIGYMSDILVEEKRYLWLFAPLVGTLAITILPNLLWWVKPTIIPVVLQTIRDLINFPHEDDVRWTLFRYSRRRRLLVEVVRVTVEGVVNRKQKAYMAVSQGVAGMAFRTEQTSWIQITRDRQEQFMTDLSFTRDDIQRFNSNRQSYLCVPILLENQVIAVLSVDSNSQDTFNSQETREQIEKSAPALSIAIQRRG